MPLPIYEFLTLRRLHHILVSLLSLSEWISGFNLHYLGFMAAITRLVLVFFMYFALKFFYNGCCSQFFCNSLLAFFFQTSPLGNICDSFLGGKLLISFFRRLYSDRLLKERRSGKYPTTYPTIGIYAYS